MKIGIVGLPGSGKTTLWDLITETYGGETAAVHMPQKPRMKTVKVEDRRLEKLRDDYAPKKYTPALIEVNDFPAVTSKEDRAGMADLLAPARDMEALIVVLRGFEEGGAGRADPVGDWAEIMGELIISDLVIVERRLERLESQIKKHNPKTFEDDVKEREVLSRVKTHLETEKDLTSFTFTPEERKRLASFPFLSGRPRVTVLNRGEAAVPEALLASLKAASGGDPIPVAARNELEVMGLPPEERAPFLEEFGIREPGRDRVIAASFRAAGRIAFFTAGDKEVRAWTIRDGDSAVEAAGEIHSDIQRGFIRAEVVSYEDYVHDGGIKGAKEKGHFRLEGKEYRVKDADIIEFRHNA